MVLSLASDSGIVGYNPEYADLDNRRGAIYRNQYWVQATLKDGSRFDHFYITDDKDKATALLDRMEASDKAFNFNNQDFWGHADPVYGSEAYQLFGGEERLCQLEEFEER